MAFLPRKGMQIIASKVRVQILTRLGAGGPPIHVLNAMRALDLRGSPSVLITGHPCQEDGDMSYLLRPDDKVYWIPQMSRNPSLWMDLASVFRIYRILRHIKPCIVHTHTAKAGTLGRIAAKLAGVPRIVHTYHGNVMRNYFSPSVSRLVVFWERQLGRITDVVCALCPQQAHELADEFRVVPQEKIRIVPLGIDCSRFHTPLSPATDEFTVGWFGRFVSVKNIRLLADTIRETVARSARVRFIVAGHGPDRWIIEALVNEIGPRQIELLEWQQDIRHLLHRCHATLLTSSNEGTPLCLIEGMAAGLPFISTGAGGVVDLTGPPACATPHADTPFARFQNGFIAPPNPGALAGALVELSRDAGLWTHMSAASSEFAREWFSLDAMAQNLEQLYASLLPDPGVVSRD